MGTYNSGNSENIFEFGNGSSESNRKNTFSLYSAGGMRLWDWSTITCDATHGWSIKYSGDNFYGCKIASWWVLFN